MRFILTVTVKSGNPCQTSCLRLRDSSCHGGETCKSLQSKGNTLQCLQNCSVFFTWIFSFCVRTHIWWRTVFTFLVLYYNIKMILSHTLFSLFFYVFLLSFSFIYSSLVVDVIMSIIINKREKWNGLKFKRKYLGIINVLLLHFPFERRNL